VNQWPAGSRDSEPGPHYGSGRRPYPSDGAETDRGRGESRCNNHRELSGSPDEHSGGGGAGGARGNLQRPNPDEHLPAAGIRCGRRVAAKNKADVCHQFYRSVETTSEAFGVLFVPPCVALVRNGNSPKQTSHSRCAVSECFGLGSIVRSKFKLLIAAVLQATTRDAATINDLEVEAGLDVLELHFLEEVPHDDAGPGAVSVWWGVAENLTNLLQADLGPASFQQELHCAIKPGSKHLVGIHDAIDEPRRWIPCIEQAVRIGCHGSVPLLFVSLWPSAPSSSSLFGRAR
jgi:hypothetical protein